MVYLRHTAEIFQKLQVSGVLLGAACWPQSLALPALQWPFPPTSSPRSPHQPSHSLGALPH